MSEPRWALEFLEAETADARRRGRAVTLSRWNAERILTALRAAGGQPPSDGMPSEPSEEAVRAAQVACANTPHGGRGTNGAIMVGHFFPVEVAREVLRQAYAAERGSRRAVPRKEGEPNDL